MGGGEELEELQADLEMLARREARGEEIPTSCRLGAARLSAVGGGRRDHAEAGDGPAVARRPRGDASPTIGDVASQARVSTATVSRVLAGHGRARPETRERVFEAARELGYRPSGVARSLRRERLERSG